MKLCVILALLTVVGPAAAQDRTRTPGLVRPLTLQTICITRWGLDRRAVTIAMKRHVAHAYGIAWTARREFEFDHLIPRSLGGADDERNLWPQRWPDAHHKDRFEVAVHTAVCAGTLTLPAAQTLFHEDWRAAYRAWFQQEVP